MTEYHVSRNGRTLGVYPEADARDYYAQGRISPQDLVWREGMPAWLAADEVFGPAPQAAAMPTAAPVPPPGQPAWKELTPSGRVQATDPGPTGAPTPPMLHWGLVLLFTALTLGIFYVVWSFIQAAWVKKLNPQSPATTLLVVYVVLAVIGEVISGSSPKDSGAAIAGTLLVLAGTVADIAASFSIRRSMLDHYSKVEPFALRLSGALTFFFGAFYLQHHMTRIAKWKQTGQLPPQ